ncbi:uncharacterized protein BT62DRAFT_923840 [Guyanagaster necrorhizus]|uniref:Uncharacterized protein n=1 Tax=Guyanagaster necrorhizus TaxID=856835 RepID=A0A9P7VHU2_9AGAR|nr:uncharacterized protein BT62DRAFT_923840 [Guyanagaster necrorhizus MCA 3950]KAG7440640.1 hypothetical protein BT62DRAFT_923840 [Guyanagaster necrorhizus MCA 3950]
MNLEYSVVFKTFDLRFYLAIGPPVARKMENTGEIVVGGHENAVSEVFYRCTARNLPQDNPHWLRDSHFGNPFGGGVFLCEVGREEEEEDDDDENDEEEDEDED